jgi:predicted site-specific integrase-resolvase
MTEPLRSLLSDNYSDFFTIVNLAESDKEDLIADLVAIVSSFTLRLYR